MAHLNIMQTVSVSSDIARVSTVAVEYQWFAFTPLGNKHQAASVSMSLTEGWLSVCGNDAGEARVTICKEMTYEEMCDMAEVLRSGFEAYVKLYGVMFCQWSEDFDVASWTRDLADALYVLRDNIAMYLNPPTEPVSAHNEGDPKSCLDAGAFEGEKEMMGEYFAPSGSVVELVAMYEDGELDDTFALVDYAGKEKVIASIVDITRDALDTLRLQYSFWVEKHGDLSSDEFMDMVLEYMEGGE